MPQDTLPRNLQPGTASYSSRASPRPRAPRGGTITSLSPAPRATAGAQGAKGRSFWGSDVGLQTTENEVPKTGGALDVYQLQPRNRCKARVPPAAASRPQHQRTPVAKSGDVSTAHHEIEGSLSHPLGPVHPNARSSKPHPELLPGPGTPQGLSSPPLPSEEPAAPWSGR